MKRIVFVISSLGSGGAERVVSILSSEFANRGNEVHILMTANNNCSYELSEKVHLHALECERSVGKSGIYRYFERLKRIRTTILKIVPDVVITFMSTTSIDVCTAMMGTKIPVIACERNDPVLDPASRLKQIQRRIVYRMAKGFVFQTKDAQKYFSAQIQERSTIIFNPLKTNLPEPYVGSRKKKIVSVGRLNKQKNYPLLFAAFESFSRSYPEYTLEIFGEGELQGRLEADIQQRGLKEKVVFHGFCKDVHSQIVDAAFFVMASDFEGMPNALIEAMAMGLPCISTDCPCGGPRTLIHNMENGVLVPIKEKDALIEAMCYLAESCERAESLGRNALRIRQEVEQEAIVEKWLSYIEKIYNN